MIEVSKKLSCHFEIFKTLERPKRQEIWNFWLKIQFLWPGIDSIELISSSNADMLKAANFRIKGQMTKNFKFWDSQKISQIFSNFNATLWIPCLLKASYELETTFYSSWRMVNKKGVITFIKCVSSFKNFSEILWQGVQMSRINLLIAWFQEEIADLIA